MAVAGNNAYPSIETVLALVRSQVLDDMAGATDTVGEGQIYVDDMAVSVTLSNFFNSALRDTCRDLRTTNGPMLIRDNVLVLGLPPINSNQGLAAPNPAVQCTLGFNGYFDGSTVHPNLKLPIDCLMVEQMWERLHESNGAFDLMRQTPQALSSVWQGSRFGEWEWRGNAVWTRGALTTRDMRLRYLGRLVNLYEPGVDLARTFVPIIDCEEVLADKITVKIAGRISPERLADAKDSAKASLYKFLNEQVKQKQGIEYQPNAFGTEAGPMLGL